VICITVAMVPPDLDLSKRTKAQKDALIRRLLPLVGQVEVLTLRVAELEARVEELMRPPKTPDNPGVPPSQCQKPNRPEPPLSRNLNRRGRSGVGRALHENPDRVV